METKMVHSMKMAGYLQYCGNIMLEIKKDVKSSRNIFIFKDSIKLREDMSKFKEFTERN